MFRNPRPNVIESDEGFIVAFSSQTILEYSEQEARWHVSVEFLAGDAGVHLYSDTLRQTEPIGDSPVNEATRGRIVDNVRRALRSQRVATRVT